MVKQEFSVQQVRVFQSFCESKYGGAWLKNSKVLKDHGAYALLGMSIRKEKIRTNEKRMRNLLERIRAGAYIIEISEKEGSEAKQSNGAPITEASKKEVEQSNGAESNLIDVASDAVCGQV